MTQKAGKVGVATKQEISSGIFSKFRWGESYTSLFLGIIVVTIAAVLIFSLGRNRHVKQTSSVQDGPVKKEGGVEKTGKNAKAQKVYVVKQDDDLWNIAVREYGDGYKWVEIAKANNLANPDLIFPESVLKIP